MVREGVKRKNPYEDVSVRAMTKLPFRDARFSRFSAVIQLRKAAVTFMSSIAGNSGAPKANGPHDIELELRDMRQLFNSMDPSPFKDKDLDGDAEEFIVGSAQEFPPDMLLRLRIHLETWPGEDPTELIRAAVHNYFADRAKHNYREFRLLMKRGRTSLLIGSLFLVACLLISKVAIGDTASTWAGIARESLTIAGWVAMWRPMEIYLYDWWPLRRRGRIYTKLGAIPVEVIQKAKSNMERPPTR